MMATRLRAATTAFLVALWLLAPGCEREHDHEQEVGSRDPHAGHDHGATPDDHAGDAEHADEEEKEPHGGHAEDAHAGDAHADDEHAEDEHADEELSVVKLSDAAVRAVGIKVLRASKGVIRARLRLLGEIRANADRLAHISPRAVGVVRDVRHTLGDRVTAGDVMAVLDSQELAEAKAAYLAELERSAIAESRFLREERLWKKKISSEQEYLDAGKELAEARIVKRTAQQKLYILGLSGRDIAGLSSQSDELFVRYEMRAPISGTVVGKHLAVGETVEAGSTPFTVADLSTVWAILTVHQKDIALVGKGTTVEVRAADGSEASGAIVYLSPMLDEGTRSAAARVVLDNKDGRWRPGTFVKGVALVGEKQHDVVIPVSALQSLDNEAVVFVPAPGGFGARHVRAGASDGTRVAVVDGLHQGERYVAEGAFELKAKLVTSGMDPHAGHGH